MIKAIVSDFSRTVLCAIDKNYNGGLNALHDSLKAKTDYDIWEYFKLNQELLTFYESINDRIDIYMFTTNYIQEWPPLKEKMEDVFKEVFSGARLNLKKDDPQAYKVIAEKIGYNLNEILFIDDSQTNLDAAKEAGMEIIRFESEQQAIRNVDEVISV